MYSTSLAYGVEAYKTGRQFRIEQSKFVNCQRELAKESRESLNYTMKIAVIVVLFAALLATSFVQESDAFAAGGGVWGKRDLPEHVSFESFCWRVVHFPLIGPEIFST